MKTAEDRKELLFSKSTNGKFYDEEGRIVGSSPWYKLSVGLFVFAILAVVVSLGALLTGQNIDTGSPQNVLYLDPEWKIVGQIPGRVAYVGWLFSIPLIFGLIGFLSKKYSETKQSLIVVSGSITALLLWALCLLIFLGFLM